jgi:hypothetical protein
MNLYSLPFRKPSPALIELKLTDLAQLFNSMDPSPFHERDLDRDAEEFIVSWAREHPPSQSLRLVIHLASPSSNEKDSQTLIEQSIQHYFAYRSELMWREFKRLMREGRSALLIGLAFLVLCQLAAAALPVTGPSWQSIVHNGLTIGGWVAMWRPLEIYLYRWWPILADRRLYLRLATMPVELR